MMPTKACFVLLPLLLCFCAPSAAQEGRWSLQNFYEYDSELAYLTDSIFNALNDSQRVAQMIVTSAGELGKPDTVVKKLVRSNLVGGVVLFDLLLWRVAEPLARARDGRALVASHAAQSPPHSD